MGRLGEIKARQLFKRLMKSGFMVIHGDGSHRLMKHPDGRTVLFAFHDRETVGPIILKKYLKDAKISEEEYRNLK